MSGDESDAGGESEAESDEIEYGLEEFESGDDGDSTAWGSSDGETTTETAGDDGTAWGSRDSEPTTTGSEGDSGDDALLDPEGLVDDTLTVVVGAVAGVVIGLVTLFSVLVTTDSGWVGGGLGLVAWLGSTAYLVRQYSVLDAIARGAYGVALVLLFVPLVMLGPNVEDTGIVGRVVGFLVFFGAVAVPAAFVAGVGYLVSRVAPDPDESEGTDPTSGGR